MQDKKVDQVNNLIKYKAKLNGLKYLDLKSQVCIDKEYKCFVIINKNLLFIDNDHFSMTGSKFFSDKIAKEFIKLTAN